MEHIEWQKVHDDAFQMWSIDGDAGAVVGVIIHSQHPYPADLSGLKFITIWDWNWYILPPENGVFSRKIRGTAFSLQQAKTLVEKAYELSKQTIKVKRVRMKKKR